MNSSEFWLSARCVGLCLFVCVLMGARSLGANPDINRDSTIDVVDVQFAVNLILSPMLPEIPSFGPADGDVDGDGQSDVVDVQLIVNFILSQHNSLLALGGPVRRIWKDAPLNFQLTASGGTPPLSWTAANVPPGLTVSPAGLVTGSPATTGNFDFQVTVTDSMLVTHTRWIKLVSERQNSPPIGVNDTYQTPEDTVLTIPAPGFLSNDTDADNDTLTAQVLSQTSFGSLNASSNGAFAYTPSPNFFGTDSFIYEIDDGHGGTDVAMVTINVSSVNDPPTALGRVYNGTEDTVLVVAAPGVLLGATDPENDPLVAQLVVPPAHGQLNLNLDGSFVYTPGANMNGTVVFQIRAFDGNHTSAVVLVVVNLAPVNDPPVANSDSYQGTQGVPLTVLAPGVLANDTDVDSTNLAAILVLQPTNGSVMLNTDGSFTYVPLAVFVGIDTFTYLAADSSSQSPPATVTITVTGTTSLPISIPTVSVMVTPTPVVAGLPVLVTVTVTDTNNQFPGYNHVDQVLIDRTLFGTGAITPGVFSSGPTPQEAVYTAVLQTTGLATGIYPFEVAVKNKSHRWKEAVAAMVVHTGSVVNVGGSTPGAHGTIQGGLGAAIAGDIVVVAPGTYSGAGINVGTGKLLYASSGPANTIVSVTGAIIPIQFVGGAIGGLTIRDATIGASVVTNALLWDCVFQFNDTSTLTTSGFHRGGAVSVNSNVSARFVKCAFLDNQSMPAPSSSYSLGGAFSMHTSGGGHATCDWCVFLRNTSIWGGAIGMDHDNQLFLNKCHFEQNSATSGSGTNGGAISMDRDACATVWSSSFVNNSVSSQSAIGGETIDLDRCSVLVMDGCVVTGSFGGTLSTSIAGNAAIRARRHSVFHGYASRIVNNVGNGVLVTWGECQAKIHNCLISGNGGVGLYVSTTFNTPISGSTFADNGAVGLQIISPHSITDCIAWGNVSQNFSISGTGFVSHSNFGMPSTTTGTTLGLGNINLNPMFVTGPQGIHYLSPLSPSVNTGSNLRESLQSFHTTNVQESPDIGTSDMGFHYWPLSQRPVRTTFITAGQVWQTIPCGGNDPPPPIE